MAMSEKLLELVIDKVFISGILLVAGYWLNKRFEIFKNEANQKYHQQQLIAEIESQQKQQITELENQLAITRHSAELGLLERQISEFYWPIFLRLEKDNVMWKRIKALGAGDNALPDVASEALEQEFILKNHQEIVEIIESKIHLAENSANSQELIEELVRYIKHVAIYKSIRSIPELQHLNPMDLNEPFPPKLFPLIEDKFRELQRRHKNLKKAKLWEFEQ